MEFVGKYLGGSKKLYLELMNDELGKRIQFLEEELRSEKELNRQLLKKLGVITEIRQSIDMKLFKPIGGYKPLRSKIEEMEKKSSEEARKLEEENARQT